MNIYDLDLRVEPLADARGLRTTFTVLDLLSMRLCGLVPHPFDGFFAGKALRLASFISPDSVRQQ